MHLFFTMQSATTTKTSTKLYLSQSASLNSAFPGSLLLPCSLKQIDGLGGVHVNYKS